MASGSGDGPNEWALHPVWRRLPAAELVEFVLKRVPFESLVRFRAVCKRFKSLITSPKFARECQRQQARKPVPVLVPTCILSPILSDSCSVKVFETKTNNCLTCPSVKVFNTKTNNWLTCPLPNFEERLYPLEVTASSGGLICFESWHSFLDFRTFVVYNLLTGAFSLVELPTPDEGDINPVKHFTSLVVDLQGGTFTLVVVTTSENEAGRKTLLYDSADGSWRSGAPLPHMECFDKNLMINIDFDSVTFNKSIYVLLKPIYHGCSTVLKYDIRSDKWSEISLANVAYVSCNDIEILENRCEVVIVSTGANEYWRLNNDFQPRRPKFFYRVKETTASDGETLVVEDREVFQALQQNEWISVTSHMSDVVTFGLGDVICFTKSKGLDRLTRVLYFNCNNPEFSFLPDYQIESSDWPEFKLVEPSLTVDL